MPVSRPFLLRLGAAAAAAATLLPALPAAADAGPAAAPPTRTVQLACPADRVTGISFVDAAGSVHRDAITCLSWYGIAQGGTDGSFGAGRAVTRGQLASFLARVLDEADIELPDADDAFSDDDGSVHEDNLDALAELGIVEGAGDGTVDPDAPVRRDQMASFLVRLLELIDDEQLADSVEDFFDDDDDNVHRGAINALAGLGIAAGKAEGIFDPTSDVLREQMATFLMQLLDRLVEDGAVRVPASLQLSAEEVAAGDVVQAVVRGDDIASVQLVGCGFDGPVADADPATDGVQFALKVPAAWPVSAEDAEHRAEDAEDAAADAAKDAEDAAADAAQDAEDAAGDVEQDCEFTVLVTYSDGGTDELDGELEFTEPDDDADDRDEENRDGVDAAQNDEDDHDEDDADDVQELDDDQDDDDQE